MTKFYCAINCGGLCKPKVVKHGQRSGNAANLTETKVLTQWSNIAIQKEIEQKSCYFCIL
jgi:hypothetical protein